jgi:hypothetical protein
MFDFRHVLGPLLDSEQAVALVKVHPKALPRYALTGPVAGLHVGKLCRFRASDLGHCLPYAVNSEQLSVPPHHS